MSDVAQPSSTIDPAQIDSQAEPPLADVLRVLLPDSTETSLLRACLLTGETARLAWRSWCEEIGDLRWAIEANPLALKGLLPLIHLAVQQNNFEAEPSALTQTRVAYLHEELRSKTYREICGRALAALAAADVPVIVLQEAAVAETVYPSPAARHCHGIDLLVREGHRDRAAAVLAEQRWARIGNRPGSGRHHISFQHPSGLPIQLHARMFEIDHYSLPLDAIWAASRRATIAGADARILSPADAVLAVCGHAVAVPDRFNLRWLCDAWFIFDRHRDLDWQLLLERAASSGLALPLLVMLRYLREPLGAPVPAELLTALRDAAAKASRADREAAMLGALTGLSALRRALFRETRSWRTRAAVLRFVLVPSPDCLRWQFGIRHPLLLPLFYLYRPWRYLVTRLRWWMFPARQASPLNGRLRT